MTDLPKHRFYVQYKPDDTGSQALLALQTDIMATQGGRAVPAGQLHLTIIHFGIYQEVLADLRRYQPAIDETSFAEALERWLADCQAALVTAGTFVPTSLARFGTHGTVLALAGTVDAGLHDLHATCLDHLKTMLKRVLNDDPLPFMRQSPNFRHALTLAPHISLIKSAGQGVAEPAHTIPGSMTLQAMPLVY